MISGLVILAALIVIAALAPVWGADSRSKLPQHPVNWPHFRH